MTSKIVVNNIEADSGISTITFINEVIAPTFNGNIVGTAATFSGNVDIAGALTYEDVTNVDSVGIITARSGIHVTGGSVGIGTDNPTKLLELFGTDPTIKLMDSSGDAYALIEGDSADQGSIRFRADPLNAGSDTHIRFDTDGSERLRITSTGLVGVNCTPLSQFQVKTATNANIALTADGSEASIEAFNDAGSASVPLRIRGSEIKFKIDGTQRARISYSSSSAVLSLGDESNSAGHLRLEAKASENQIHGRSNHPITFLINTAEKLRIDSDGRVLFAGATSSNTERLYVKGSSSTTSGIFIHNANGATNSSADLWFGHWTSSSTPSAYAARISALNKNVNTGVTDLLFHVYDGNNALERLRITSGGNVNIGGEYSQTDSKVTIVDASRPIAEATLNLQSSTTSGAADTGPVLRFYGHSGSEGRYHASIKGAKENGTSGNTAGYLALNTRPAGGAMAERLRITSGGYVNIGGNFTQTNYTAQVTRIGGNTDVMQIKGNTGNSFIRFTDSDATSDFTLGSDDGSGSGAGSFVLYDRNQNAYRMFVSASGRVGVNDNTGGWAENFQVTANTSHNQYGIAIKIQSNSGYLMRFATGNAAPCGSISGGSGNSTSFNTSWSDSRRKKNFETWNEEVLPYFKSLEPKKFNFTQEDDGTVKTKGYVAQDNVDKFPEAYPSLDDSEVDEKRYMFNPSGMVIYLMKALQEEIAKREALESRITALES